MNQLENTLTSLEVADMVGRDHGKVMRDIARIIEQLGEAKNGSSYFTEDTYISTQNKELPCYRLTKKGCELFSTRMTGAKGTQFAVAYIERFNQMEQHIKQQPQVSNVQDDYAKRLRAKAMDQNARNRAAKALIDMANNATSDVNKALLQNKAVEIMTGEKLLEMPTLRQKFYSTEEIAVELGIFSESKKPHSTAVSQFIKTYLTLEDDEFEVFAESSGNWSGSVTKYAESVLEKVEQTIKEMGYPMFVPSKNGKNYHIYYRNIA
ncbi:Rha family transcriptional regulator [Lactococcus lactis]|uniref:Rha family transcriptional regulator n=3 Tax=Lactococcus lactis TaxID=1358 RepID=A0AB35KCD0_9LACT|nr:Rha family transcriptional regulator [Lactococcus lactis]MDG4978945.1 Rha family transcriptional regulator [Lactococcus lactis]MDG5048513.1 Rha family transcriptional regulator [Lactococcus lactis]